jgi:hypothetical protein
MALPPKLVCDNLYRNFLCYVNPAIPILHLLTFHERYERFWDWYLIWDGKTSPEGVLAEIPSFLPLMLSVLFTASLTPSTPESVGGLQQAQNLQRKLYQVTSRSLTMVGFPQDPAICALEAFVLMHSVLIKEEEAISSCSFIATACRIAQAMGLHRDGTEFNIDSIHAEERRRLWWYIMHLDVMASLLSGLPLILSSEYSTTRPIAERKDELVSEVDFPSGLEDFEPLYPGYVLARGRYEISSTIRNILQSNISLHSKTSQVQSLKATIKKLSIRTEARIKKLISITKRDTWAIEILPKDFPAAHAPEIVAGFVGWASDLLWVTFYRAYCLIYFPLLQDKTIWAHVRIEYVPLTLTISVMNIC